MVRLHLIGAEDVDPDGYPYELVAQSWGTTAHRRRRSSQNVRKPRKDKGKGRATEHVLPETAEYVDNLGQVSDSGKFRHPCPLLEASPQMPPAEAPSLSVTRKVVLTVTVTVNKYLAAQSQSITTLVDYQETKKNCLLAYAMVCIECLSGRVVLLASWYPAWLNL